MDSRRSVALGLLVVAALGACEWGLPTATIDELAVGQADVWPDMIGLGTSTELEVEITVPDGSAVTGAPVKWVSSDTSVVKVVAAVPPTGANFRDSLTVRLRATMTGVGRGSARITVLVDALAGFAAAPFEHDVSVRERWLDVSGGAAFSCGVNFHEDVYCWGNGDLGQLGNGGSRGGFSSPQPVGGGLKFTAIDSGWDHACARATTGLVYCWGLNVSGELGSGDALSQFVPTRVALGRAFDQVSAGNGLTCGILPAVHRGEPADGSWALCWGGNNRGQIGADLEQSEVLFPDPDFVVRTGADDPAPGGSFSDLFFSSVDASGTFACGIVSGDIVGGAWCWGDNSVGQLGDGEFVGGEGAGSSYAKPVLGPIFSQVATSLTSAGTGEPDSGERLHACGLTEAGAAWCWGSNDHGQLGTGRESAVEPVPLPMVGDRTFKQISLGEGHSCGVDPAGTVYCWGRNDFGQVGNGQTSMSVTAPVAVSVERRFVKVSAGAYHTCALTVPEDGGAIFCWGRNTARSGQDGGQLGNGTFEDSSVPTRVIESVAGE